MNSKYWIPAVFITQHAIKRFPDVPQHWDHPGPPKENVELESALLGAGDLNYIAWPNVHVRVEGSERPCRLIRAIPCTAFLQPISRIY